MILIYMILAKQSQSKEQAFLTLSELPIQGRKTRCSSLNYSALLAKGIPVKALTLLARDELARQKSSIDKNSLVGIQNTKFNGPNLQSYGKILTRII